MTRPRLAIADDHRIFAEGLRALLEPHCEIVGLVEDGTALIDLVETECPGVVLSDVSMPGLNGFECLRRIRTLDANLHSRKHATVGADHALERMSDAHLDRYRRRLPGQVHLPGEGLRIAVGADGDLPDHGP